VIGLAMKNTLTTFKDNVTYNGNLVTGQQVIQLQMKREVDKQFQQILCSTTNENEKNELLKSPMKIMKHHLC
jgi:hypothetical protein